MAYTVEVNRDLCTSVASCVAIATKTFKLDDDGIAIIKEQNGDPDEIILQAAQSCPVNAIIVKDENGKQIHPKE